MAESESIKWGILGAGGISSRFVNDILVLSEAPQGPSKLKHFVKSIGCSNTDKGDNFIREHFNESDFNYHNPKVTNYMGVIDDEEVDIVYIGLLHPSHKDIAIKALNHGKHVLCEKPVTMNSKELAEILAAAKKNGRFFMEAMWVRFFPAFVELQKKVHQENVLGKVKRVIGNYSINAFDDIDGDHRIVNKKLGGGAALDIGIYSLTYCRLFLDPNSDPRADWDVTAAQTLDSFTGKQEDEVDFITTILINNKKFKQQAIATSSIYNEVNNNEIVVIEGEKGRAVVQQIGDTPGPLSYKISLKSGEVIEEKFPFEGDVKNTEGFFYQAAEAGEMIRVGKLESTVMPWKESISIMSVLDKARQLNGLVYEQDLL